LYPATPTMLKSIICLCIFVLITVNAVQLQLNDKTLQFLARIKLADLPESVRLELTANQARGPSEATHWCCINEQPITTATETKVVHATRTVATKTKVGYVDCGIWGWGKCSHYVSATRAELYTYIDTFQIPNLAACNSHEVKCCSGYILVAENCHSFQDLLEHKETISWLSTLGLLGSIGK